MPATRFPIRIGARSAGLLRVAFGVTAGNAWAEVDADAVEIRFGRFGIRLAIADIAGWRIEGPWPWITAIGVRSSILHGDISFAGSPRGGVRLDLRSRVRWGRLNVVVVYVGVEDLEGFAAALTTVGVSGEDARLSAA